MTPRISMNRPNRRKVLECGGCDTAFKPGSDVQFEWRHRSESVQSKRHGSDARFRAVKMTATTTTPEKTTREIASGAAILKLVLPKEHGSWSLALEPLALGILVAPSVAGGALVVAALAAFLLRRPLKLVLVTSGKPDPRFWRALTITIALSLLAIAGLLATVTVATGGLKNLWPLIPAAIAGLGFAWFDSHNETRQEAAELCGVIAFGVLPATFGKLAGWSAAESMALAAVMLVRSVSTVLFVRTYLRRKKGYATNRAPAFVVTGFGFFLTVWLVAFHLAPWPVTAFAFLLAAGTFWVLGGKYQFSARKIGVAQLIFGLLMIFTLALTWKITPAIFAH